MAATETNVSLVNVVAVVKFRSEAMPLSGGRIALPLAADGLNGDGVLGASDYEHVPFTGLVELTFENIDWFRTS